MTWRGVTHVTAPIDLTDHNTVAWTEARKSFGTSYAVARLGPILDLRAITHPRFGRLHGLEEGAILWWCGTGARRVLGQRDVADRPAPGRRPLCGVDLAYDHQSDDDVDDH